MYGGVIEDFGHGIAVARGTVTMDGGIIQNCQSRNLGGRISCEYSGGMVIMNGGKIENCYAMQGGGIFFGGGAGLTLNGGTIENCHAYFNGGGIYTSNMSSFIINDITIRNCTSDWVAAGIYVFSSSPTEFIMNGGLVTGCANLDADQCSNGIQVGANITMKANGGRIEDTVSAEKRARIVGSGSGGTAFCEPIYQTFNAGTSENLKFDKNGRLITEYQVAYYAGRGVTLYFNNENSRDLFGDGTVSYDDATKTVTLHGASLTGNYTIWTEAFYETLTIVLKGDNTAAVSTGEQYISHLMGDLIIKGDGTLRTHKIQCSGNIFIEGGDIVIDNRGGNGNAVQAYAHNTVKVSGGTRR